MYCSTGCLPGDPTLGANGCHQSVNCYSTGPRHSLSSRAQLQGAARLRGLVLGWLWLATPGMSLLMYMAQLICR